LIKSICFFRLNVNNTRNIRRPLILPEITNSGAKLQYIVQKSKYHVDYFLQFFNKLHLPVESAEGNGMQVLNRVKISRFIGVSGNFFIGHVTFSCFFSL